MMIPQNALNLIKYYFIKKCKKVFDSIISFTFLPEKWSVCKFHLILITQ